MKIPETLLHILGAMITAGISYRACPMASMMALMALLALMASRKVLWHLVGGACFWLVLNELGLLSADSVRELSFPLFQVSVTILSLVLGYPSTKVTGEGAFASGNVWVRRAAVGLAVISLTMLFFSLFRFFPLSWAGWGILTAMFACSWLRKGPACRRGAVVGSIILFLALLLTTAALTEAGARLLFSRVSGTFAQCSVVDPEVIFRLVPGGKDCDIFKDNSGSIVRVDKEISSQGIRNPEVGPKKNDEFRIVLLGDSYTMGFGLKPEETISFQLEALLNAAGLPRHFSAINCGIGGYAPWQERVFMQRQGFTFEPDLVILQIFPANDVAGSYTKLGKYLPVMDVEWEQKIADIQRNSFPFRVERFLQRHSVFYRNAFAETGTMGLARRMVEYCRFVPQETHQPIFPRSSRDPYHEVCLDTWYPELYEAWSVFEDSVRGIRDDCRERNIPLAAYAHGEIISLWPYAWVDLNAKYPDTPYKMNKDICLVNEMLGRLEIPSVNVFAAFAAHPEPKDLYYIYDGHFSPAGARLVATCLRDHVLEAFFPRTE